VSFSGDIDELKAKKDVLLQLLAKYSITLHSALEIKEENINIIKKIKEDFWNNKSTGKIFSFDSMKEKSLIIAQAKIEIKASEDNVINIKKMISDCQGELQTIYTVLDSAEKANEGLGQVIEFDEYRRN
jgi:hypothetical protein